MCLLPLPCATLPLNLARQVGFGTGKHQSMKGLFNQLNARLLHQLALAVFGYVDVVVAIDVKNINFIILARREADIQLFNQYGIKHGIVF